MMSKQYRQLRLFDSSIEQGEQKMGVMKKVISDEAMPFLARFEIARTGEDRLPGYYSTEMAMWVVDSEAGPVPIIDHFALAELMTKTKVNAEQDDEGLYSLEELKTVTEVRAESDDVDSAISHLLELVTKTDTVVEKDDAANDFNQFLELVTKTSVQVEKDDNGDPASGLESQYFND